MAKRGLREKRAFLKKHEEEGRMENRNELDIKKRMLSEALHTNSAIPHQLRGEASNILDEIVYNANEESDEEVPPRIAVTTSHSPSSLLKSFSKHLSLVFNGQNLMRGKMSQNELNRHCTENGVTHLIILNETKGNPTSLTLCKYPYGPTYKFSLFRLKYQRRAKNFGEKVHLIVDGMESEVGKLLKKNLSLCFPMIKEGNRLIAFINRGGTIAVRHFTIEDRKLVKDCEFDMRIFKIINSTIEADDDVSYVYNAFTNTRKEDILSLDSD